MMDGSGAMTLTRRVDGKPDARLRRVSVLLNSSSGTTAGTARDHLRQTLEEAFRRESIEAELAFLSGPDLKSGAEDALQKARDGKFDAIVAGGGDGTIRTVASVVAGSNVPLGILPLGTLNHFAKDLKLPLSIQEAVAVIAAGATSPVDVGEVNGEIFINNSSIGIYPYLVLLRDRRQRSRPLPKWLATCFAGLEAMRNFPIRRLSIRTPGREETFRSPCVFIGNNPYRFSGSALGGRDSLDRGELGLYVAKPGSRMALLRLALQSILGRIDHQRDLRSLTVASIEIGSRRRQLLVACDGEIQTYPTPLIYKIRPGALRIIVDASAGA